MQTHARTLKIHRGKSFPSKRAECKMGRRQNGKHVQSCWILFHTSSVAVLCLLAVHWTPSVAYFWFLFNMSASACTQNAHLRPPHPTLSPTWQRWRLHRRERRMSTIYRSHVHLRRAKVNDVLDQLFGCSEKKMKKKKSEKRNLWVRAVGLSFSASPYSSSFVRCAPLAQ